MLIPEIRLKIFKEFPTKRTIRKWFKEVDKDDYARADRDEIIQDLYNAQEQAVREKGTRTI